VILLNTWTVSLPPLHTFVSIDSVVSVSTVTLLTMEIAYSWDSKSLSPVEQLVLILLVPELLFYTSPGINLRMCAWKGHRVPWVALIVKKLPLNSERIELWLFICVFHLESSYNEGTCYFLLHPNDQQLFYFLFKAIYILLKLSVDKIAAKAIFLRTQRIFDEDQL